MKSVSVSKADGDSRQTTYVPLHVPAKFLTLFIIIYYVKGVPAGEKIVT